jgi:hypothetical protein
MDKETEELRQRMSRLSDDELMIMLTINPSDYRKVAINLATEEVLRRRISSGLPVDESFVQSIEKHGDSPYYKAIRESKGSGIAWLPAIILLSYFVQAIPQYYPLDVFGIVPIAIVGGLLILPLGIILFAIREKHLMLYARLEILFGMGLESLSTKQRVLNYSNGKTKPLLRAFPNFRA